MLDTNMCVYLIKYQPEIVRHRFEQCYVGEVVMSAITYAELQYGVRVSSNPEQEQRNLASLVEDIPIAPFEMKSGIAYGTIRLATRERKTDQLDKLIAAHAVSLGVVLVTNNEKDFAKYPGLRFENWLGSYASTSKLNSDSVEQSH